MPEISRYQPPGRVPAWAIIGVPDRNGVTLLASTKLDRTELEGLVEYSDGFDPWNVCRDAPASIRYTVTLGMRQVVMVKAPTYAEALAHLLYGGDWNPDQPAEDARPPIELPAGGVT